ncbi:S41 family peptidase [Pontixanthobacter sp. CEM42]|uniref:S41 family peptidase n=1 Tax=Pontixanthobacter sp. CEM42 TaxID=2792077 RepID=UPI001ADFC8BB|nr:S41 family peptidase [Pontixanthobacter sp. CEM42]
MSFNYNLAITALAFATGTSAMASSAIEDVLSADETQGVWLSDGYGILLDVSESGQKVRTYDYTDQACVETTGEETHFSYMRAGRLDLESSLMELRTGTDPYDIRFRRIGALPDACQSDREGHRGSALANFDAFVSYFKEHYAFFDVHNPEWLEQAARIRSKLDEKSGESDIIEPMIGLLSSLKDGHVSIQAVVGGEEGEFIAFPGPTLSAVQQTYFGEGSPMAAFGRQFLRTDIEQAILGGQGRNAVNERIKYGITSDDIGYMAVMSMGGYAATPDASEDEELAAINDAMDEIISYFNCASVKAIIIDISVNRGGYDYLAREIARRFASKKTLVSSKFAGDATNRTPQPLFVEPVTRPSFAGPIYVLTSDVTVSAAEALTLSLRALPNVTHVGSKTRGALSDVLEKKLPNGWVVTLSNEVYLDHEGVSWEGKGIPPEHEWQVFDPSNPFTGHLPSVERTIALIDKEVQ